MDHKNKCDMGPLLQGAHVMASKKLLDSGAVQQDSDGF